MDSHKVLFLTSAYFPKPKANEICVMKVQEALLSHGIQSDVIIVGQSNGWVSTNKFGDIYAVKGKNNYDTTKKRKVILYFKAIPFFFCWPIKYPSRVIKYIIMVRKLIRKNKYEAVIGDGYPAEIALATAFLPSAIIYELDSMTNSPEYQRGIKRYLRHRTKFLERIVYSRVNFIIHMAHNKKYYDQSEYGRYRFKSTVADIPLLVKGNVITECKNEGKVKFVYTGALVEDYRSPRYLIEIVKELAKHIDICCDFYTRGNCENILKQEENNHPGVICSKGYVEQDKMEGVMTDADFLISIGNNLTGFDTALPSKVINYIATGKPIIHIDGGNNDIAKEYLEKYGLSCIVNPQLSLETNVKDILKFIRQNIGKQLEFQEIRKKFPQNSPEYSAQCIIQAIAYSR